MAQRPQYVAFAPAAEDTDGIANDLTGAGPWTPNVAAGPNDGMAHQVSLSSSTDLHTINFTVVGTDADDQLITETLAGPTSNTVETTGFFKTVTSISAASTIAAATLDVGWVDEAVSRTIAVEWYLKHGVLTCGVELTGTANFDLQGTVSDIRKTTSPPPAQASLTWVSDANFTGKSASLAAQLAATYRALRLKTNSYTSAPALILDIVSPR